MMRILDEWVDEPMPLVDCKAHNFQPFADLASAHTYRCIDCGRLARDEPGSPISGSDLQA